MKASSLLIDIVMIFGLSAGAQASEWQPKIITKTYAIAGSSPIELYTSIGEKGPLIGKARRTIALTQWDLKWRRDYQPDGSDCVLKSAIPFLTITYVLPKPVTKLSGDVTLRWQRFFSGIEAHEKVHGRDIVTMTESIIANTVGLRINNDAECKAIRAEVLKRVQTAADEYKAKSRVFDKTEMSERGNVHSLILGLING